MLKRLSGTLRRYAQGWLILALLALEILFNAVILPGTQARMEALSGGVGPIDLQLFYTPEKAYSMIAAYGDVGRAQYRLFELTGDIIYPIVYTLFFSLTITWLFRRGFPSTSAMQRLNVIPFGAWLFDLLENLGIVAMLTAYPARPGVIAWPTAAATTVKWGFAAASLVLLLIGLVMALKNRFRPQA